MLSFHNANPQAIDITPLPNLDQLDAWAEYSSAVIAEGVERIALNCRYDRLGRLASSLHIPVRHIRSLRLWILVQHPRLWMGLAALRRKFYRLGAFLEWHLEIGSASWFRVGEL